MRRSPRPRMSSRCALDNHRIVTNPMEPRGAVGMYDAASGRYTLHVSSQNIHGNRDAHRPRARRRAGAGALHRARCRRRLRRQEFHLCRACADPVGGEARRPAGEVDRDAAARCFSPTIRRATIRPRRRWRSTPTGKFLALRVASVANLGAYLAGGAGGVQTYQYVHLQGTVYAIPAIALHVAAVLTNTTPIGVMRGPGFAEAVNIIERLIDAAARQCGFDRAELRRRNMVPAAAMPMTNAFGFTVDSGAFRRDLRPRARSAPTSPASRRAARDSEARGLLRGLGFAYHIKGTGGSPHENVDIRFEADGTVSLITGTQTIGQGHETTFPQILADRLGVPNELIRLRQGDTDLIPMGGGHGSSRATYMGGTAIWRASDEIIEKGSRIAAEALEAAEADIALRRRPLRRRRHRPLGVAARCGGAGARGRHAARHLSRLDARAHDLPQRHACRRGRDRSATPARSRWRATPRSTITACWSTR